MNPHAKHAEALRLAAEARLTLAGKVKGPAMTDPNPCPNDPYEGVRFSLMENVRQFGGVYLRGDVAAQWADSIIEMFVNHSTRGNPAPLSGELPKPQTLEGAIEQLSYLEGRRRLASSDAVSLTEQLAAAQAEIERLWGVISNADEQWKQRENSRDALITQEE